MIGRLTALLGRPWTGARPPARAGAPAERRGHADDALPVELRRLVAVAAAVTPGSAARLLALVQLGDDLTRAVGDEVRALAAAPRDARVGALLRALGPIRQALGDAPPLLQRLRRELEAPSTTAPFATQVRRAVPGSARRTAARGAAAGGQAIAPALTRVRAGRTLVRARHGA